jgi:hypothetical protein
MSGTVRMGWAFEMGMVRSGGPVNRWRETGLGRVGAIVRTWGAAVLRPYVERGSGARVKGWLRLGNVDGDRVDRWWASGKAAPSWNREGAAQGRWTGVTLGKGPRSEKRSRLQGGGWHPGAGFGNLRRKMG